MTRISLLQTFNQGLKGILNVQSKLLTTQNQLATGKRVNQPSDDPVASAQILQLDDELSRLAQYKKNINGAENSLMLEETQLEAVTSLLARVRELTIQAGDGALSVSERRGISAEVRTRLDELLALANTRSTSGEYIFGGYRGEQAPFVASGSGYAYRGDNGQRMLQISSSIYVAMGDNGNRIFEAIPQANVPATTLTGSATISSGRIVDVAAFDSAFPGPASIYRVEITAVDPVTGALSYEMQDGSGVPLPGPVTGTFMPGETFSFGGAEFRIVGGAVGDTFELRAPSTQGVLNTIARLADGLQTLGDSPDDLLRLQDLLAETLGNLDNAEVNVGTVRAEVGARLNTLDSTRDLLQGSELVSNKVMSEVRDLDYAEAITRLTMENTILQAAQQSFAKISRLSLFDFLR
jgi:flagellar hook-associated protein 3 FlgL